ncbi:MAG TPA: hypothetical protein VGE13_02875, partial [Candidatus Saccharimonadales bacterium]
MNIFSKKSDSTLPPRRRRPAEGTDRTTPSVVEGARSFRRNRTITGSSSQNVSSTAELNATMLSPRAQVHHLNKHRRHLMLKLTAVVVASLAVFLLVSQLVADVSIRMVKVSHPVSSDVTDSYTRTIEEYYGLHPLARYYPSTDQKDMLSYLQVKHPEIKNIDLALAGEFGKAQAAIELREPVARWIVNDRDEYVDGEGVVFSVNGFGTPGVTIVDQNKLALDRLNKKVITSNRFLVFVGQVVGEFAANGRKVTRATVPVLTTRQLQIKLSNASYFIKMTIDRPAGEQAEDALRVIS